METDATMEIKAVMETEAAILGTVDAAAIRIADAATIRKADAAARESPKSARSTSAPTPYRR